MNISHSERRQIENEMIFRRSNEKVADDLDTLDAMHIEDGNVDLIRNDDLTLEFKCECSDEDCTKRIAMSLETYKDIHTDRNTFVVIPHHEVECIEKVIEEHASYSVVRKDHSVPEPVGALNETNVDNS